MTKFGRLIRVIESRFLPRKPWRHEKALAELGSEDSEPGLPRLLASLTAGGTITFSLVPPVQPAYHLQKDDLAFIFFPLLYYLHVP